MMMILMSYTMSFIFMFLKHPLSLGLILLIQTIIISMLTGMMNYNFWFSYILFLIMIGGMLILFIYMTSIASNEKFKFNFKLFMFFSLMMILILIFLSMDKFYVSLMLQPLDVMNQNLIKNNYLSMNKYLNYPNILILYTMIIHLFITLIMVVKITNIHYGPLRQKL
uniref:NADH-ubiquinone oxidoreductase chain 6 n=1 Tax=Suinzona cyrtonoides TaxID=2856063 RepID=A0A8F5DPE7_9CUCU|nr:NADH dehydrogenase subunit 6 [Suinzona cyrtonoides]